MILHRWTMKIKIGKFEEAINLLKEGNRNVWSIYPNPKKIYTLRFGDFNTLVLEIPFENIAEMDQLFGKVGESEEWASWVKKWNEVTTDFGKSEIWYDVES